MQHFLSKVKISSESALKLPIVNPTFYPDNKCEFSNLIY